MSYDGKSTNFVRIAPVSRSIIRDKDPQGNKPPVSALILGFLVIVGAGAVTGLSAGGRRTERGRKRHRCLCGVAGATPQGQRCYSVRAPRGTP
jgi:hypothetical protein